ncbi:50S ribosomal protein L3 N(5)-glutamine methyltransferase [Thalassotalea piscium]|uniref:Ribosomal protein uL3 glutamine methyltransferase n=1 Tax=Thalassotalea piscium TaxID=1230533 RepID=A0A7X0NEA8_9GAMM|nr:50S ribosomal protein L3 N(5)-glutamine methyltransferase [Thalassotalea piscium]MBB6541857.1 ribosomal protein L3 glutamine methyltransferase [Thalassotalea piscium]
MSHFNANDVSTQLHTIGDFIRFATSTFNQADLYFGHGQDNAWDEAITLVTFSLNLPSELTEHVMQCQILTHEKEQILALISRRVDEEIPAAYLINQAHFAGLPFYVDERVLVPRSPIAELIEQRFNSIIDEHQPINKILDLCTGSGCIAIACATFFPEADVDAADLSIDALNVAQINIENHGLTEQVIPIQSDVFSGLEGQKYDLIVTNPPYVDSEDVDSLPAEFQHEPEMGLGCGEDGLDIVRKILAQSATYLANDGWLVCEVGNSQVHVEALYPEVDFRWITFERGGHGVFALSKAQLEQNTKIFNERMKG